MVFANLFFLYAFLPLNLILYFATKNRAFRNAVLIFFSLAFYAWGEPVWITLLIFSATIDYFHGLIIEKFRGKIGAKLALISSLTLNLGLLAVFKYSGFFVENINLVTGLSLPVPQFALPIGISFYTFQTLSYTIDVYRDQVEPQYNYMKYFMYVSLYAQLVAGPIVRYADVAIEVNSRKETLQDAWAGATRFLVGLTKKVCVANVAGKLAESYLSNGNILDNSTAGTWFGVIMYAIQIYYDFSGYSDMAIGLGRIFGFHFLENFNYPYISRSATEFWRRWHMSLGQFFRDYVYIPLGGNRKHQFLNLFIVWFLTGFWHGASWNFILWGLWFGVLIVIEKLFLLKVLKKVPVLSNLYLLLVVLLGWVLFYYSDLGDVWNCLKVLFGFAGTGFWDITLGLTIENHIFWIFAAVLFCLPVIPALKKIISEYSDLSVWAKWAQIPVNVAMLLINTALLVGSSYNPFIYYNF